MRTIACQPKDRIAAMVSELSRCPPFEGHYTTLGMLDDQDVIAGFVYTDYVPSKRVQMHAASQPLKHWATDEFIQRAFRYPFIQLDVKVVIAPVRRSNKRCTHFIRHVGGYCTGCIPKGWGDEDMLLFTMTKEQCRWI